MATIKRAHAFTAKRSDHLMTCGVCGLTISALARYRAPACYSHDDDGDDAPAAVDAQEVAGND